MNNKRKSSTNGGYYKKARTISFVGVEGYDILDFFDYEGRIFEYGKSGLAIELLKLYREAINVYGREEALFRMKLSIEKDSGRVE